MTEMQERTYTTVDRSDWPAGPWESDPLDKVQYVDDATGLDCLAVRSQLGNWCGYVGIPASHPWHGVGYSECTVGCKDSCYEHTPEALIDVHGALTYADACQEGLEEAAICHVPFDGRPDDVWWFGFDCAHLGDLVPRLLIGMGLEAFRSDVYRDLAFVREQNQKLAAQLAAVSGKR